MKAFSRTFFSQKRNATQRNATQRKFNIFSLIALLFTSFSTAYAQNIPNLDPTPKVIPPSPNAASLGKYGNFPVSLYSGTPQISIPLATLEGQSLSAPISVSYHASGIKVDDIAGNVGLGWALNAGGAVTRTVKGLPDESYYGILSSYRPHTLSIQNALSDGTLNTSPTLLAYYQNAAAGNYDSEPDVFNFNINGYSGKFVIDTNKIVRLIPYQDIKIVPFIGGNIIDSWLITTPDGIQYTLGGTALSKESTSETSRTDGKVTGTTPAFVSTWYLTKILDVERQDSIVYKYTSHGQMSYVSSESNTRSLRSNTSGTQDPVCVAGDAKIFLGESKVFINGVYVSEIVSKRHKAVLSYSGGRSDLLLGVKLNTITIYSMPLDSMVKKITFGYGSFSSPRLKLESITESNANNEQLPPHTFNYLDNDYYELPSRLSAAQDHWGFYNGQMSNPNLLPTLKYHAGFTTYPAGFVTGGANRFPHPEFVKAGMINKITFPTGGFTIFDFEANRSIDSSFFDDELPIINYNENLYDQSTLGTLVGGVRIRKISSYATANATPIVKMYEYRDLAQPQLPSGRGLSRFKYSNTFVERNIKVTTAEPGGLPATTSCDCTRNSISSSSQHPLTAVEGGHVVYPNVTELIDSMGLGGKSTYVYSFTHDYTFVNEAMMTVVSQSWRRGQLLSQKDYAKDNAAVGGFRLIKTTENRYSLPSPTPLNTYIAGLKIRFKQATHYTYTAHILNVDEFLLCAQYSFYDYNSRWLRLDTTIVTEDNIQTTSYSKYNETGVHINPIEVVTTNSDGKVYSSKIIYSTDIDAQHPNFATKQNFANRGMIMPLEIKKYIDGNVVNQGSTLVYDMFNGKWVPKMYFSINKLGQRDTQVVINYNTSSLPNQVYKKTLASVPETYSYNANNLLETKTYGTLTQSFTYTNKLLLASMTDENGLRTKFTYDGFMRLSKTQNRFAGTLDAPQDVQATTDYAYQYKDDNNPYSFVSTVSTFKGVTAPLSTKQYMDGLGRPIEVVKEFYTPPTAGHTDYWHQKNYVSYDALGRQNKTYLPFENGNLGFQAASTSFNTHPYVLTTFEASPLSRPISQQNVDGTFTYVSYGANIATDAVQIMTPKAPPSGAVASAESVNTYAANTLSKTTMTDENGKLTCVFKDKLGRVVLTRKFLNGASGANVDTYNVYDDYGQLVVVVPPGALTINGTNASVVNDLTFQYKYDNKNRLSEKKIPSAESQRFYYDDRDLLTLTQDGNMRTPTYGGHVNKYLATEYDALGRVVKTGWVTTSSPATFANSNFIIPNDTNKLTETQYYPNKSWVKHQGAKVLKSPTISTVSNFLWSYTDRRLTSTFYTGNPGWQGKQHLRYTSQYMSQSPITDSDSYGVDWSVSDYNGMQQPEYTIRYLFESPSQTGEVRTRHSFTYDNARRLTDVKYAYALFGAGVSDPTFTLSNMVYNHKDQLIEKNIGMNGSNTGALQSIDYQYNLRGWLTNINNVTLNGNGGATNSIFTPQSTGSSPIQNLAITPFINKAVQDAVRPYYAANANELPPINDNNDLFSQVITYNNPYTGTGATPQSNGNISSTMWQVAGRAKQAYGFTYDGLDRLTEANYFDIVDQTSAPYTSTYLTDNKFKEAVQYDVRGNIISLQRHGLNEGTWTTNDGYVAGTYGLIDNLVYNYKPNPTATDLSTPTANTQSNQLLNVKDMSLSNKGFKYISANGVPTYTYDANGNLTSDLNKGISEIQYNYLNLPIHIRFDYSNGTFKGMIQFVYDATGVKLKKIVTYSVFEHRATETYDYINGVEYKNDVLQRIAHTEGSVSKNEHGAYEHQYVLRDHLGNTRVTFRDGINKGDPYMDWNTWQYIDPNAGNTTGLNDGFITSADIIQVNHYYPFGLNMEGNWQGGAAGQNKYQYNGKELNRDFELDWNDYGARFYDPALARWTAIDFFVEKYTNFSPYNYTLNNPIKFIDPNGKIVALRNSAGNVVATIGADGKPVWAKGMEGSKSAYIVTAYLASRAYLNEQSDGLFTKIEKDEQTLILQEENGELAPEFIPNFSEYQYGISEPKPSYSSDKKMGILYWNPTLAIIDVEKNRHSPAATLLHELIHVGHFLDDLTSYYWNTRSKPKKGTEKELSNREEEITINEVNVIVKKLGNGDGGVRKTHLPGTTLPNQPTIAPPQLNITPPWIKPPTVKPGSKND